MQIVDTQPPVHDQDLDRLERELGLALPEDLRGHYRAFNGGRPVPHLCPAHGDHFSVHEFLPIKHGPQGALFEDAYRDLVLGNARFPVDVIPFAIDPGGDHFCYSLQRGREGQICVYQAEHHDDPDRVLVYVADSLADFLASLVAES